MMSVLIDDFENMKVMPISDGDRRYNQGITNCIEKLKSMTLTDEEQRIFLAAMGREEKICEEFHNTTLSEVLAYIDGMPEDVWQEFTACLECRGWYLVRRGAKWCGSDFA